MDTVKAKICVRRDTTENWEYYGSTVPLDGEVIVYTDHKTIDDEGNLQYVPGIKIGDGVTTVANLPFTERGINIEGKADKADTVLDTTLSRGRKNYTAIGTGSIAFGYNVTASGAYSQAYGNNTEASGDYSQASGSSTDATGSCSVASGVGTAATGNYAVAEGNFTQATGYASHAEGTHTQASNSASHAEGGYTEASGSNSHAEGSYTVANKTAAHAEGYYSNATGTYSHAEGRNTTASHENSHAEGYYTTTAGDNSHVSGKYNVTGQTGFAEVVGGGTSTSSRKNIRALDWNGNEYLKGNIYVGSGNTSSGGSKVATESFVTGKMGAANGIATLNANGKVPESQLPAYVDDVLEFDAKDFSEWPEWVSGTSYVVGDRVKETLTDGNETTVNGYICTVPNVSASILPSEWDTATKFPETGENGKIYIALDTNLSYRWGGTVYVAIASDLSLGETEYTAYRGDRGAAAYAAAVTNVDTTPTTSSTNLITSGGVKTELDGKADKNNPTFTGSVSLGRKENTTVGTASSAFGYRVEASGNYSHAEGQSSKASAPSSHAEGYTTKATGEKSHAEGSETTASGSASHAEGLNATASGSTSHAEGNNSTASGNGSHAEGSGTTASGISSHAEGYDTQAKQNSAHAEGYGTIANASYSHVVGKHNIPDSYDNWPEWVENTHYYAGDKVKRTTGVSVIGYICKEENTDASFTSSKWETHYAQMNYVEIVGNGASTNSRSNARVLDWDGNERLMGDLYVGCNADSTGGAKVLTATDISGKMDVDDTVIIIPDGTTVAPINIEKGQYIMFLGTVNKATMDITEGTTLSSRVMTPVPHGVANDIADIVNGMTASATTLSAGSSATAEITEVSGHLNIAFGIPAGPTGATGATGATGDPAPADAVADAVDDYLENHFTNPSNPPLDRSLTSSLSAAPADVVGDYKDDIENLVVEYTKAIYPNPRQLWDKSLVDSEPYLTENKLSINTSTRAAETNNKARVYMIEVNGETGDLFTFNLLNSKTFADYGITSAEIYASNSIPANGDTVLQRGSTGASNYRATITLEQDSKYIVICLYGDNFTDASDAKTNCDGFMDNTVVRKGNYNTTYYEYSIVTDYTTDYKVLPMDQGLGNAGKTMMVGSDGIVAPVAVPDVSEEITEVQENIDEYLLHIDETETVNPRQLWNKALVDSEPYLTENALFINTSTKAVSENTKSRVYTVEINGELGDLFTFNLLNSKTFADYGIEQAELYASNSIPANGDTMLQRGSTGASNYRATITLGQDSKYLVICLYGGGFTDASDAKTNCDGFMSNTVVRKGNYDTTYYEYSTVVTKTPTYYVLPNDLGIENAGKMLIVGGNGKVTVGTVVNPEASDSVGYFPLQSVTVGSNMITNSTPVSFGSNWSGSLANGLTHTTGADSNVLISVSLTEGKRYLMTFNATSHFEESLFVAFGNDDDIDVYTSDSYKAIGFVSDGVNAIYIHAISSLGVTITDIALYELTESGTEIVLTAKNVNHGNTEANISGFWNVAIGDTSTQCSNISGTRNIAIGLNAQSLLKQGNRNISVGTFAMAYVKEGERNVSIGADALYSGENVQSTNKAYDNVAIGKAAMHDGALIQRNVAIGSRAMKDGAGDATDNVVVGFQAGNYSHNYNTFVGKRSGYYTKGSRNVGVGIEAGGDLYVTGSENIAIGSYAGIDNTGASAASPKTIDNTIAIGANVKAKASNQAWIGRSDQTIFLAGKKIIFNLDGTVTWEEVNG